MGVNDEELVRIITGLRAAYTSGDLSVTLSSGTSLRATLLKTLREEHAHVEGLRAEINAAIITTQNEMVRLERRLEEIDPLLDRAVEALAT